MTQSTRDVAGRTARKRESILEAATALFLRYGFRGTSMDQVAALAEVSKQTVYKQFVDKEQLFRTIIAEVSPKGDAIVEVITAAFGTVPAATRDDLERRLHAVARTYLDGVLQPQVLSLRRLIIAEADEFPDLAERYYAQAPARGIETVADCLRHYVDVGLLHAGDVNLAASHFAYLVLSIAQDRAQFMPAELPDHEEREALVAGAVRVFLAAYGGA